MKQLLNEKLKTVFLFILILVLILAAVLGFSIYNSSKSVKVPDFNNMSKSEVLTWCGKLNPKFSCEIVYEDNENVDVDKVISQSVHAGTKIKDKITFTISTGARKEIIVPVINTNTTKDEIENWITDNKLVNVTFIEQNSDSVKAGNIIKLEPTSNIISTTPINVYVSIGPKQEDTDKKEEPDTKPSTDNTFYIAASDYIGYSVSEFENKAKALGLNPNHQESRDAYSDSVEKGLVVWHGYGNYEKGEIFNYGISKGKSGFEPDTGKIEIEYGEYINTTEDDFKSITTNKGLKPYHDSDTDEYSETIEKGKIVWHGSGSYEDGESIRYGLSKGINGFRPDLKNVEVEAGQYVNISEEEFKTKTTNLGLKPYHDPEVDDYSDTVSKGKVVWHGSGTYENGESIRYGLSKGSSGSNSDQDDSGDYIVVESGQFVGLSVSEFESKAKSLGLTPVHISDRDAYSTSVIEGNIVSHGYGNYVKNEAFKYGVSLGKSSSPSDDTPASDTAFLGSFNDINNACFSAGNFDEASSKVKSLLANAGFTNYTVVGASSKDVGVGVLMSISVNGNNHTSRTEYKKDASIVVTICETSEAS